METRAQEMKNYFNYTALGLFVIAVFYLTLYYTPQVLVLVAVLVVAYILGGVITILYNHRKNKNG